MIVSPDELREMAVSLDDSSIKQHAIALLNYHTKHCINNTVRVSVPMYWAETILSGLKKIHEEFPQLKLGSIVEVRNRLRVFTVPTHNKIEDMKIGICNEVDTLILETISRIIKGDKKPGFIS
jgi:hypothetical protein